MKLRINDGEKDQSEQDEKEDPREADTNILIPDTHNQVTLVKRGRKGVFLMAIGGIIFFISLVIQLTTYIGRWERAAPIYAIVTGLHLISLGVFLHLIPKDRASFEVTINGSQVANSIPIRAIILATINFIFAVAGIVCVSVMGPYYDWPAWNVIGLLISLLIAVVTMIHLSTGLIPSKYQLAIREAFNKPISMKSFDGKAALDGKLQDMLTNMAATTMALFPEFSTTCLGEILRSQKSLRRKSLHHTMIAFSMLLAAAIFAAQLFDIIISPKNTQPMSDPEDTYARKWIWFLGPADSPSSTKLMVLISTPVTFLLCLPLFFLTHRSSTVHLILAFILAGAMAGFHCFLSVATMSWMIRLGTSVTPLSVSYNLRMGITLTAPILTSLLLSMSFSYLDTLIQKKEQKDETSSCCRKTSYGVMMVVALLTISLTIAALFFTTGGMTATLQHHWNSTESGQYKDGCRDLGSHGYYDYERWNSYNRHRTTPTPSTGPKPDYCYDMKLDYIVENTFQFFSQSQLSLSEALLFLSLLLLLTGNKISRPVLLFIGVITFAGAITTVISYFTGVYNYPMYVSTPNLFQFYILNGCQVALGLVLGFGFSVAGCGFFVSLLSILLRTIIAILALSILLLLSLVVGIINLAKLSTQMAPIRKEELRKEVNIDASTI